MQLLWWLTCKQWCFCTFTGIAWQSVGLDSTEKSLTLCRCRPFLCVCSSMLEIVACADKLVYLSLRIYWKKSEEHPTWVQALRADFTWNSAHSVHSVHSVLPNEEKSVSAVSALSHCENIQKHRTLDSIVSMKSSGVNGHTMFVTLSKNCQRNESPLSKKFSCEIWEYVNIGWDSLWRQQLPYGAAWSSFSLREA